MWKKNCREEQATDDNMAHAHCMLDTYGYKHKHTHRICNTYCFCTATMVTRTRPIVTSRLVRYTYIAIGVGLQKSGVFWSPVYVKRQQLPKRPVRTFNNPRLSTASHLQHRFSVNMPRCLSAATWSTRSAAEHFLHFYQTNCHFFQKTFISNSD